MESPLPAASSPSKQHDDGDLRRANRTLQVGERVAEIGDACARFVAIHLHVEIEKLEHEVSSGSKAAPPSPG